MVPSTCVKMCQKQFFKITTFFLSFSQPMGCRSYVELAIHHNMVASVDVVMSFLNDLSDTVRHKADEVFKGLKGVNLNWHT